MWHQKARQATNGYWHWTSAWSDRTIAYPPCTPACEHKTPEEAERHHYEYEIAQIGELVYEHWEMCEHPDCKAENSRDSLTNKAIGGRSAYERGMFLCDKHRNKEIFIEFHPFKPGVEIWGS